MDYKTKIWLATEENLIGLMIGGFMALATLFLLLPLK